MSPKPSLISGMRLLSSIINKDAHWKIRILNRWAAIAGDFAAHLIVNRIEDETLFLEASHPMWGQEAQGSADVFIDKIAEICGHGRITKIVVRGCKTARTSRTPDSGKQEPIQRTLFSISDEAPFIELTAAEQNALNVISHENLSTSMAEFYKQCKRRSLLPRQNRDIGEKPNGTCDRPDCRCAQHHVNHTSSRSS